MSRTPLTARRTVVLLTAGALAVSLSPFVATSADAAGVKVRETGTVKAIADGDTVWVDIKGDHSKRLVSVRLAGIQATEVRHKGVARTYNQCHGQPAKAALSKILLHRKVQLRSTYKSSKSLGRKLRFVYVKRAGKWTDVQQLMILQNQAMSLTLGKENAHDRVYSTLAQRASRSGRGLWATATCGVGPAQATNLHVWVHWDAAGVDARNPNDEYVVVENRSTDTTVSLAGWMLRDSSQAIYRFPSYASVGPRSFVRVHVGRGSNSGRDLYWGLRLPLFQNPDQSPGTGDFAILMDPRGDFRSWASYPCRYSCGDPLAGKVAFTSIVADSRQSGIAGANGEKVVLTNLTDSDIELGGYFVVINGWLTYTFSPMRVLGAHDSVTLKMGVGTSDQRTIYLNQSTTRLPNNGGTVRFRNWNGVGISCDTWGNGRC